jgi:beta-lactamase superfamily II metal-dependent hydrolase
LEKTHIHSVLFPKNLSSAEVKALKPKTTEALDKLTNMMDKYTGTLLEYSPPFKKASFYLHKTDFPGGTYDTNKLSQLIFVNFNNTTICIPGDLTFDAWDKHLQNQEVQSFLRLTDVFIASHHGREDGFNEKVFSYCKPEVIILSDSFVQHGTQQGMSQLYASKITGNGIVFNANRNQLRKTLTTRSDGHIWIRIESDGSRTYRNLNIQR